MAKKGIGRRPGLVLGSAVLLALLGLVVTYLWTGADDTGGGPKTREQGPTEAGGGHDGERAPATPATAPARAADPSRPVEPQANEPRSDASRSDTLPGIALELVSDGLRSPVYVTHAGDGSGRLFVVEQEGRIRVLQGGTLRESPYLDLRQLVKAGGEQGLLGLAFHPDFERNGWLFVSYTDRYGDSVLARYDVGDPATEGPALASGRVLLKVAQPYPNHNGGHVAFGPDRHLYWGLGDGGGAGDPQGHGQNTATLLGGLLRLAVNAAGELVVPEDNPFVGREGRDELWAIGLRNPWRFSFDRETGDLYIADVGQSRREEVNFEPAGTGGRNYGWNVWEGTLRYRDGEPVSDVTFPVVEYATGDEGCAVTGGYVYRGSQLPVLRGVYLFSDYCSGILWGLVRDGSRWHWAQILDTDLRVASFGEDEAGELYIVDHGGAVYRIAPGMTPVPEALQPREEARRSAPR